MNLLSFLVGFLGSSGILLIFSSTYKRRIPITVSIAPYIGNPIKFNKQSTQLVAKGRKLLTEGNSAPWASDKRIQVELRRCASEQNLTSFRIEQIIFAAFATLVMACWVLLKVLSGSVVNPILGLLIIPTAFVGGGGFRSWLLKETSRKRIKEIESQLPAILDLLAFAVSAGEPIITALQRVSQTCSGELSKEISQISTGLSVGDNFLASLDRVQKELDSNSISRTFRALIMAIERGTPIAEVLRAQAMDARSSEARKLMTLAGKKETLMMIPVVFLILPMIVIVALYPGLIALRTF